MDLFLQHNFDQDALQILNKCHLNLHATVVADIAVADSSTISQEAWEGKHVHRFNHNWPNTPPLSADKWHVRLTFLHHSMLYPHRQGRQLGKTFGRWKEPQDAEWLWWFNSTNNIICEKLSHRPTHKWIRSNPNHPSCRYQIKHSLDEIAITPTSQWCATHKAF